MNYSLNEIESMCKRAARGAGMHWGLAEEAGKATRWLTTYDLPGVEGFASLLTRNDAKAYDELAPLLVSDVWKAASGDLCPLSTGAAICDRADVLIDGTIIKIGSIAHPLLLSPFAAAAAKMTDIAIELSWSGVEVTVTPNGVHITGALSALSAENVDAVQCKRVGEPLNKMIQQRARQEVDARNWRQLNAFAQRTYAPATEASRLAGAGAGLTDTD